MKKCTLSIVIALALCLALLGCGGAAEQHESETVYNSNSTESSTNKQNGSTIGSNADSNTDINTVINTDINPVINTGSDSIINTDSNLVINAGSNTVINTDGNMVINTDSSSVINTDSNLVSNVDRNSVINTDNNSVINTDSDSVSDTDGDVVSESDSSSDVSSSGESDAGGSTSGGSTPGGSGSEGSASGGSIPDGSGSEGSASGGSISDGSGSEGSTSGGSISGGSESGGSTPSVLKATLNIESDVTDRSYLKAGDILTAKVTNAGDAQVTYQWKKKNIWDENDILISDATDEKYTIKSEDVGNYISVVVVVAPKNGEEYSLYSEKTDCIRMAGQARDYITKITVPYGTDAMILKNFLNANLNKAYSSIVIEGEYNSISGTLEWNVTDTYNGNVAGDYIVNGTIKAPGYCYLENEADVTVICQVTVKPEGALQVVRGEKVTSDVSGSAACAANQNIFDVSMKGQTIVISGVYANAAKEDENVPLMLKLYAKGAESLQWSKDKDGGTWIEIGPSGQNGIELYLNEYLGIPKAVYVKDGDDGVVTPVYIQVDVKNLYLVIKENKPYETELDAKTFPNVGTIEDLNLPAKIAFTSDAGKVYEISVTWACDKVYGKEGAGTYTFYPTLGEIPAFTYVFTTGMNPISIELKDGQAGD